MSAVNRDGYIQAYQRHPNIIICYIEISLWTSKKEEKEKENTGKEERKRQENEGVP